MAGGIPSEAVGVFIGVLLYSIISLFLCLILVGLLITYGERYTYVTIHSSFTALSTLASIVQQIHYALRWQVIKQAQFDKAIRALTLPGLTFVGGAHVVDMSLFFIQFWCYNIMALNIFFWSIDLFTSAWNFRTPWLGDWLPRIGPISKIFSIIFPALIIGLLQARAILVSGAATFIISNGTMFLTLSTGSILLILILYRYMKTRRLAAGGSRRGRWWASQDSKSQRQESRDVGSHYTMATTTNLSTRSSIYDRALVTRFSIGFVILAFFLAAIIIFSYVASTTNSSIVAAGRPDLSTKGAITDILLFLPGVTASLVTFLVFGTAKSWRQYRDLLVGGCGIRNKIMQRRFIRQTERSVDGGEEGGLEFAPLPRLQSTPSLEERIRREEAVKRVRMFAREVQPETGVGAGAGAGFAVAGERPGTGSNLAWGAGAVVSEPAVRAQSSASVRNTNIHFHRPRPSLSGAVVPGGGGNGRVPTPSAYGIIEVGLDRESEDLVVQSPGWQMRSTTGAEENNERILVTDVVSVSSERRETHWPANGNGRAGS